MTDYLGLLLVFGIGFLILITSKKFMIPPLIKLNKLLNEWKPKKDYEKEAEYRDDLFRFLRKKVGNKIEKRKEKPKAGRRYEDLLYHKLYPIELKYNFNGNSYNQLRTQIEDYINHYKHINEKELNFLNRVLFSLNNIPPFEFFLHIRVFIVICRVKDKNALNDLKKSVWVKRGRAKLYIK